MVNFSKIFIFVLLPFSLLMADSEQTLNVKGENNRVTQIVNKGISSKKVKEFMQPYKDRIETLESKLLLTVSLEVKHRLSEELLSAKEALSVKSREIEELNKFIKSTEGNVAKRAIEIYEKNGLKATLEYFKSKEVNNFEKISLKKIAERYRAEAKFLQLDNQYLEAKEAYEKAITYDKSIETRFDYAYFLEKQNYFEEAIALYEVLLKEQKKEDKVAIILNNLANLYKDSNQVEKAEEAYLKALSIYLSLSKKDTLTYTPHVATTLNNLANLYGLQDEVDKAKEAYLKALKIRRDLEKHYPKTYRADIAMTLNNLAILYRVGQEYDKAEKAYVEALNIYRCLAKSKSIYRADVAMTLNNLANLYSNTKQVNKIEKTYVEALALYRELSKVNPVVYKVNITTILNNLTIFYISQQQIKKAKKVYVEGLSSKRELYKLNKNVYGISLANSLIMGVDMLNQPKKNLEEAKKVLKNFKNIPKAQQLLTIIGKINNR